MAFVAIPSGVRKSSNRVHKESSTLAVVKAGRLDKKPSLSLQITVSVKAMKAMRWIIGDKVEVFFDDEFPTLVLLKRVNTGGRSLSCTKGTAGKGSSNLRGIVKFTLPAHLPFKHGDLLECTDHEESHGGLLLSFPW